MRNTNFRNQVTCTNGNGRNGICGSRITVYGNEGQIIDRFTVPARNGKYYCQKHAKGEYSKRYFAAIAKMDAQK